MDERILANPQKRNSREFTSELVQYKTCVNYRCADRCTYRYRCADARVSRNDEKFRRRYIHLAAENCLENTYPIERNCIVTRRSSSFAASGCVAWRTAAWIVIHPVDRLYIVARDRIDYCWRNRACRVLRITVIDYKIGTGLPILAIG